MSSGSTFTLYRKYNKKATEADVAKIISAYVKTNREHDYSESKKDDSEYSKDIPLILDPFHGIETSKYDKKKKIWIDMKDHSIDGQRSNFKRILKTDNSHLDKLLEWDFCSSFNCLKNEWNMSQYEYSKMFHVIDKSTASAILQACNYLISGKWSDEFEAVLDNRWIKILADGNDSFRYWQYTYRNNKKRLNEILEDEGDDSDLALWQIKRLKSILETFANVEEDYGDDKTEVILVYSAW